MFIMGIKTLGLFTISKKTDNKRKYEKLLEDLELLGKKLNGFINSMKEKMVLKLCISGILTDMKMEK